MILDEHVVFFHDLFLSKCLDGFEVVSHDVWQAFAGSLVPCPGTGWFILPEAFLKISGSGKI